MIFLTVQVAIIAILNSGVLSRYISKRSLLGGDHHHHHHEEPSAVYLPPPGEEEGIPELTEPVVETTTVLIVKPPESYLIGDSSDEAGEEVSVPNVVDLKNDDDV